MDGQAPTRHVLNRYRGLARTCRASYRGPINHRKLDYLGVAFDLQKIVHGSFRRGFCRVFHNRENVVVAFRGTRENIDWSISNFRFFPKKLKSELNPTDIMVHSGFQAALYYTDSTSGQIAVHRLNSL